MYLFTITQLNKSELILLKGSYITLNICYGTENNDAVIALRVQWNDVAYFTIVCNSLT